MADNEAAAPAAETKEKRTVPGMERTFRGIIEHADKLLPLVFDKERNALKDPKLAVSALFGYAKRLAGLSDEAEARNNARQTALEVRVEKLEQQVAAFQSWRADVEKQSAEMEKGFEAMMGGDPVAKLKEIIESRDGAPALPPSVIDAKVEAAPDVEAPSTVVPLKPEKTGNGKKHDRAENHEEKNGGAA